MTANAKNVASVVGLTALTVLLAVPGSIASVPFILLFGPPYLQSRRSHRLYVESVEKEMKLEADAYGSAASSEEFSFRADPSSWLLKSLALLPLLPAMLAWSSAEYEYREMRGT